MSIEELAEQLKDTDENIILIYAFNATGKTRLSVAYKNATKNKQTGEHAGVYYNAFSEDLFVWDNDEDNDGININLSILPSTLNRFHSFFLDQEYDDNNQVMQALAAYNPQYKFKFNAYQDREQGIESVTFYMKEDDEGDPIPIKISRGEERIFVWCFYLALLEVDGWADEQSDHIFIDDPVSSLDEHNIFVTADSIFKQIQKHHEKKRIIVTTHHIGLFATLCDRLKKGEKAGRFKNITKTQILKRQNNVLKLVDTSSSPFLSHLHLLEILSEASKPSNQLYTYHFALLRQLLENISSYLGGSQISRTLYKIGIKDPENAIVVINSHAHKTPYYYQTELMSEPNQALFTEILREIQNTYQFKH